MWINVIQNWCFFSWISLSYKNWWKKYADRKLIFEKKRQEALEKKLGCKIIRIDASEKGDTDYEIGRIQPFINKFKNRKLKKKWKRIKQKSKRIRRRNKKIATSIDKSNYSTKSKWLKHIVKKILPLLQKWLGKFITKNLKDNLKRILKNKIHTN